MSGIGAPLSGGLVWQPRHHFWNTARTLQGTPLAVVPVAPPAPVPVTPPAPLVVPIEPPAPVVVMPQVPVGALALTQELIVATSAALSGGLPAGGVGASGLVLR